MMGGVVDLHAEVQGEAALGHPAVEQASGGVGAAGEDEREAGQVAHRHGARAGELACSADHENGFADQGGDFEASLGERVVQTGEVHRAPDQPFMNVTAVTTDDFD